MCKRYREFEDYTNTGLSIVILFKMYSKMFLSAYLSLSDGWAVVLLV